ncbi:MAG TPA: sulfite oxidase [Thermoleophilaceae bacterium]|jgi:sulfane dehydrogenase subunit SoxC|nr:sulfite oxidase [Thermoleophilaceae bacterium]
MEGAPVGTAASEGLSLEELRLAARNHGLPLEALRYPVTPVGLHYLLIHFDIPAVEAETFRLAVAGAVERPLSLSLDDLRGREQVTMPVTFECAGNGRALLEPRPVSQPWLTEAVGTAEWRGTPLAPLLEEAGVEPSAVEVLFRGLDRGLEGDEPQAYERSLPLAEAQGALLAYEMNGGPLPPQHGFPLRLVVPGWYGMANVKWLAAITLLEKPFDGYQNAVSYRMYEADGTAGEPVTRMLPRSLTVPPGVPEFMSRERYLDAGPVELSGRAWSGHGVIERVEVSTDGGSSFSDADLGPELGRAAWRGWTCMWQAPPGEHVICSRATDSAGNTQPLEPPWNLKGYANNALERIPVIVAG